MINRFFAAVVLSFAAIAAAEPPPLEPIAPVGLHDAIEAIRTKANVPAIGVLVSEGGKVVVRDAWGEAKIDDSWHIGSDTKAMTATIAAAVLEIEQRAGPERNPHPLRWDSTIEQICPDLAKKIDAAYRPITLEQLLTHTSGISDPKDGAWLNEMRDLEKDEASAPQDRRAAEIANLLARPPSAKLEKRFEYSNLGYLIAGHMLECDGKMSWEDLMWNFLDSPLGIDTHTLHGGTPPRLNGHDADGNATTLDNPATLGPAGTVNLTLDDWLKFCEVHAGHGPKDFLSADSLKKLHTPALNNYATGWAVIPGADGTPVLTHDGSNTFWYARAVIRPSDDRILLITLNKADAKACDEITAAIVNALWSPAPPGAPAK